MMTSDPKILFLAFVGGIIPALLWLWFWLKEDKQKPEPKGLLTMVFIMGMLAVVFVLKIKKFIQANVGDHDWQVILWAGAEEIIKYLAVLIVLVKTNHADEPL